MVKNKKKIYTLLLIILIMANTALVIVNFGPFDLSKMNIPFMKGNEVEQKTDFNTHIIPSSNATVTENNLVNDVKDINEIISSVYKSYPNDNDFELPVIGSSGFNSIQLDLFESPDVDSKSIKTLPNGSIFVIKDEIGDWWLVETKNEVGQEGVSGWVEHKYCLINLPDVLPSVIYQNTNSYDSRYKTSGEVIPGITGETLYHSLSYNERLGRVEYIMPVLYTTAKKISEIQKNALQNGESLLIYELFRPLSVQNRIVDALIDVINLNPNLKSNVSTPVWGIDWFVYSGVSNHQVGYAIDVSLVKIDLISSYKVGEYEVLNIQDFTEYTMPTAIHELSVAAIRFNAPVSSRSETAWLDATFAQTMTDDAKRLQNYFTNVGFVPLASEWWHFNDISAMNELKDMNSNGDYTIMEIISRVP